MRRLHYTPGGYNPRGDEGDEWTSSTPTATSDRRRSRRPTRSAARTLSDTEERTTRPTGTSVTSTTYTATITPGPTTPGTTTPHPKPMGITRSTAGRTPTRSMPATRPTRTTPLTRQTRTMPVTPATTPTRSTPGTTPTRRTGTADTGTTPPSSVTASG